MRRIATFNREGFTAYLDEHRDGSVTMQADGDIDADGANGQFGAEEAYNDTDTGSEALANGGMKIGPDGRVTWAAPWGKDIVLTHGGQPLVMPNGIIPSKTSYVWQDALPNTAFSYVDSATVPYVVAPPELVGGVSGIVKGCKVEVVNTRNGRHVFGMVGDVGPRNKCGEVSIKMAELLGIPSSPRSGGVDDPVLFYTFYPGVPAVVNGRNIPLMSVSGRYINV